MGVLLKNALHKRVRQRFFVTPVDGLNFDGVLVSFDRSENGYEVYDDVVVYLPDAAPEKVKGLTYIRHSNVAYVQELPPNANH